MPSMPSMPNVNNHSDEEDYTDDDHSDEEDYADVDFNGLREFNAAEYYEDYLDYAIAHIDEYIIAMPENLMPDDTRENVRIVRQKTEDVRVVTEQWRCFHDWYCNLLRHHETMWDTEYDKDEFYQTCYVGELRANPDATAECLIVDDSDLFWDWFTKYTGDTPCVFAAPNRVRLPSRHQAVKQLLNDEDNFAPDLLILL